MNEEKTTILLIEDNKDFAKLLEAYLQRFDKDKFVIIWKENYSDALTEIETNSELNIVVLDYFLPGKDGLEIAEELIKRKVNLPIVFLTANKDFDLAVKVMKLGIADYLVKEEISSLALPKTILSVIERHQLKNQLIDLEVKRHRLRAIREKFAEVGDDLEKPLLKMKKVTEDLGKRFSSPAQQTYIKIISDNVARIMGKLDKLKNLKEDKSIKYIKDIKMIDLS